MRKKILFLMVLMLTSALTIMAQITTSSMAGKVTFEDVKGEEVIGATVVAVHEPSGTRYTAVTNVTGNFTIQGMRTGGPYEVTFSYIGYQPKVVKGVTLELAETYNLNVWLSEDANVLTEVVVSGKASKFAAEKTGAATNINNAMITNMPTVNRNITDVVRLSPYGQGGGGMGLGGGNGKMTNFTVDGANFNNNFGLSDKLPGNGNPISLDAIEEMQVVVSPFDVRQTNFIGGGVNAITKSGTNTFKGTAYIYHKNENMQGDAVDREQIPGARDRNKTTTYGFTFGGPIIKNKLFFFASGELVKSPAIINRWRPSEGGAYDADNYLSRVSVADMDAVANFVRTKYGYEPDSYTNWTGDTETKKLLARLDWNITDKHHLSLRYNYTKSVDWTGPSMSTSGLGSISYSRIGLYSMSYSNSMYKTNYYVKTFALDLNSRLTDNLSNQLLLTYSKIDQQRESPSSNFPFIDILDGDGGAYISLGYEPFTWNNAVNNNVFNIKDDVTWYLGSHTITGGISYEHQMAENIYMKFGNGYYRYESMNDFFVGAAPSVVALTYGYDGAFDPGCRVNFNQLGVYLQDDWRINNKFKLTYGLRFDGLFFNNDDLMTNNAILALDYNGKRVDTGKWPNSTISLSPRVGFTWDVFGDKSLKLRGGTGLFLGRLPLVFFTNMPSNANMYQFVGGWSSIKVGTAADMTQFAGGVMNRDQLLNWITTHDVNGNVVTDSKQAMGPYSITPEDGTASGTINGVNPDFKMPQVWKTSLAIDYQFPTSFPLSITLEGIFNKTVNGVCISDWSLRDVGGYARLNGADSRAIYQDYKLTYTDANGKVKSMPNAYVLDNTSKGYGFIANVTVNAQPFEWMSLMAAYTHTVQKELTGMPGSNASSAFSNIPSVDGPNFLNLHNSSFVTPDRIIASATIHDHCNNHYSLIYEGWRGDANYSYMLANNITEDANAYDLIYIPTDLEVANNQFRFVSEDDKQRFMDYVHQDDYLSSHQGEYAEAYSVYSPWVHRIDFSYKHDFKLNVGKTKHMLQLSFDMKNVLNFFNSSWGVAKYMNPDLNSGRILKYEGADAQGYATFSTPKAVNGNVDIWTRSHSLGQCWYASIGVRYVFN